MVGQFFGCALFGYFAIASFLNVRQSAANRKQALADFGPDQEKDGKNFLRLWIALNVVAVAFLGTAAILVWFNWQAALGLACIPIALFALASLFGPSKETTPNS